MKIFITVFILLFAIAEDYSYAGPLRKAERIPAPGAASPERLDGQRAAVPVAKVELPPLKESRIGEAVNSLAESWNSGRLGEHLDAGFYNRERLLDALSADVPRDAALRVTSIRNIRRLEERFFRDKNEIERVSRVSATVETQIEFNDPVTGFQRLRGSLEMIFNITETFREAAD